MKRANETRKVEELGESPRQWVAKCHTHSIQLPPVMHAMCPSGSSAPEFSKHGQHNVQSRADAETQYSCVRGAKCEDSAYGRARMVSPSYAGANRPPNSHSITRLIQIPHCTANRRHLMTYSPVASTRIVAVITPSQRTQPRAVTPQADAYATSCCNVGSHVHDPMQQSAREKGRQPQQ